jgi:hypothetical protein
MAAWADLLKNDPKLVDRLKEIRDGTANLELTPFPGEGEEQAGGVKRGAG